MSDFPPVLTVAEMRAADAAATADFGVPSLLLMENAGRGVAELVRRELAESNGEPLVALVCGAGANGGDGFVAARHLACAGVPIRVFLTASPDKVRGDAAAMRTALERMGVPIEDASGLTLAASWSARLAGATVLVDAIFGTGVRGAVTGAPAAAIAAMNEMGARRIAVDVPSGLDADTGRPTGPAVFHAELTATMGARKLGLVLDPAAPVGRLEVVGLGAPIATDLDGRITCRLLAEPAIAARLPRRAPSAHKGSSGHLVVVAGSPGKTGAAVLVGLAGLRTGAGLVTIVSNAAGQAALDAKVVEVMTASYADEDDPEPGSALGRLRPLFDRAGAIAIGPGIPTGPGMSSLVREIAKGEGGAIVLDADGLNALGADGRAVLAAAPGPRIITPHPGEMARLAGVSTSDIQADRLGHARRFAAASRAIVVLKGARTVIAAPDGATFVSPIACPSLATAGTGDVLCGVIGALLGRGLDPLSAAQVGVYLHGAAGLELATAYGDGAVASDLPATVAEIMARLTMPPGDLDSARLSRAPSERRTMSRGAGPQLTVPSAPRAPGRAGGRRPPRPSSPKPSRRRPR